MSRSRAALALLTALLLLGAFAAVSVAAAHRPTRHHKKAKLPVYGAVGSPPASATTPTAAPTPSPSASVPAVCPGAQTPDTSSDAVAMRLAIVCLVNQQRVDRGLPAVTENPLLDLSAQLWTDTMVATGSLWHGTDFSSRISKQGYGWQAVGENIATGYATPDDVIAGWMASTDHCQNILDPDYSDIGVGVNPAPVSAYYNDAATWTEDFGLKIGAAQPSQDTGPQKGCPYTAG